MNVSTLPAGYKALEVLWDRPSSRVILAGTKDG